jgi:hypothetical protein
MKKILFVAVIGMCVLYPLTGCKTPAVISETVDEERIEESIFSARRDTVRIQTYEEDSDVYEREMSGLYEYFTVQIGAFKDPINAERVYRKAQQQFNFETNTDYDSVEELYKITVGKFINYEQARSFCDRIMRDFPKDYHDAWVVEITQRQRRQIQQ